MQFTLTVNMDNAAFEDANLELETILNRVTERVQYADLSDLRFSVLDSNGNKVGMCSVSDN